MVASLSPDVLHFDKTCFGASEVSVALSRLYAYAMRTQCTMHVQGATLNVVCRSVFIFASFVECDGVRTGFEKYPAARSAGAITPWKGRKPIRSLIRQVLPENKGDNRVKVLPC